MKIDATITLSIIVALAAIFVPSLTTYLNNRHDSKIRREENKNKLNEDYYLHVRNNFENMLSSYGEARELSIEGLSSLKSTLAKCIPYIPEENVSEFLYLIDLINDEKNFSEDEFDAQFKKIISITSNTLNQLK
ncbi:MAG: hypothetical protein LBP66_05190 [Lactococcus lactis]|jgi:hypothetical protein|nr:hypothetical protein [Lactococcus lactis]